MRITAVFHDAEINGPAKTLRPRLERLARDHEVESVLPSHGRAVRLFEPFAEVTILPYRPLRLPDSPAGYVRAAGRLARDIARFRAHLLRRQPALVLIVSTVLPAALLGSRAARVPALVYAGEIAGRGHVGGPVRALAASTTIWFTRKLAASVIACSGTVERQFGAPGARLTTIYPGISPEYASGDRSRIRRRLGLSADAAVLAVVGNLSRGRGQDLVIRALPVIRERFAFAHLLVVGGPLADTRDDAYRDELKDLVHSLDVDDAVHFLGVVDDVEDVYAAADVVLNPSRFNEPFGRVAVEALVAGRPVVATRVGAIPEVLREGVDALIIEPDDVSAMAAAACRLLDDRDLAARLVAAGQERVRSEFSERRGVEAFTSVVEKLLAEAR